MSDTNDEELEVYTYQGMDGEKVPETAEKLIVEPGVQILPKLLCWRHIALRQVILPNGLTRIGKAAFNSCRNLSEISICNTVQCIGSNAFQDCEKLTKVEFEHSTSSPHQLQEIGAYAFGHTSLQKIKLPSSVTTVGYSAFGYCESLIEADLSSTSITQLSDYVFTYSDKLQTVSLPNTLERIDDRAFYYCESLVAANLSSTSITQLSCAFTYSTKLQTVSLPNTLERIWDDAFSCCLELVTVVVPIDSQPIKIESGSFQGCQRLANFVLPKGSTADEYAFDECNLLHERYGGDSSRIIDGLVERFANFSIHKMCYDHERVTVEELRHCIAEHQQVEDSLVDEFRMTPFHIFFSNVEPRLAFLDVLLDLLPNHILLKLKDANDKRPLDYLIQNWTCEESTRLLERTLQKSMIDRLACWGATSWMEATQSKVQELLAEDDQGRMAALCDETYSTMEHYETVEATSVLELALWKGKLKSGSTSDGSKRQNLDRGECRLVCGSDVVIPHVVSFLLL